MVAAAFYLELDMITHSKPWITESDRQAVEAVLQDGFIAKGPRVKELEDAVLDYTGCLGGMTAASGTAALFLALKALGISEGDEVVVPTYVCRSVSDAVIQAGGTPVFCDVGLNWNMTVETVEKKLTAKTRAVILVHIYGIPADFTSFRRLNLPIIEDACQAFGAAIREVKVGALGELGVYSFHATKCLTTGEGGMVTANTEEMLEKLDQMQNGRVISSPLTDMQAALGLSQLSRYDAGLNRRRQLAERYFSALDKRLTEKLRIAGKDGIFFRFVITSDHIYKNAKRDFFENDIHIRKGVDALLHRGYGLSDEDFPNACRLFDSTISLPIYPALTDVEQEKIIQTCGKVFGS
jgi:UDP-4-amino-4-deoxy-L-arabinose-oxoglutarate aminotransferase